MQTLNEINIFNNVIDILDNDINNALDMIENRYNDINNDDLNIIDVKKINSKEKYKGRYKEYFKLYYLNNPEKYKITTEDQKQRNREKVKRWMLRNPDKVKINNLKRPCKKRNIIINTCE